MKLRRSNTLHLGSPCLVFLFLFTGCSQKTLDREHFQSDLKSSISFAAEAEMFLTFVIQGKSTDAFAEGHAGYLEQELDNLSKELRKSPANPSLQNALERCRKNIELLQHELHSVPRNIHESSKVMLARSRIESIHADLAVLSRAL